MINRPVALPQYSCTKRFLPVLTFNILHETTQEATELLLL